jgi:mono/diheme cytochrome c family protein
VSRALVALVALVALAACAGDPPGERLGGVDVPGAVLARGRDVYARGCAGCHGEAGDGRGPSARGLVPPPRDFRTATFKYAGAVERELPSDAALARVVREGLPGTAMRAWGLPPADVDAVVQYVKAFSPPGTGFRDPARPIAAAAIPPDPFAADPAGAMGEGARLYHATFQCASCHPAYADAAARAAWGVALRADADRPAPRWSGTFRTVLVPTDFGRHPLRSVRDRDPGPGIDPDPADLYRVIAYGLGGPMPGYAAQDPRAIWQVAHYVAALARGGLAPAAASGTIP